MTPGAEDLVLNRFVSNSLSFLIKFVFESDKLNRVKLLYVYSKDLYKAVTNLVSLNFYY